MQITMIGCPFKTSYGNYIQSLKSTIENKTGATVLWAGSNCGCGDPVERRREFQTEQCGYFEMPHVLNYAANKSWKHWLRVRLSDFTYSFRAKRYWSLSEGAEIAHFQQTLHAHGSSVVFHWLSQPSTAARVVTIHELDSHQLEFPAKNRIYNRADALIVHCEEMKQRLVALGVQAERIHVVLQGVAIPSGEPENTLREAIVFYGGHKLMSGKGLQTLFQAMALLKQRLGAAAPTLKIHGHYGNEVPEEALRLAAQQEVSDKVVWLNQISFEEIGRLYRSSAVCVLPYTGGFAGLPAAMAAANGLPVVCTRNAGLTDHLGECGVWIEENNAEQLAGRVTELLDDPRLRREISEALRARARQFLSLDAVADRTLDVYELALKTKGPVQESIRRKLQRVAAVL